MSIPFYAVEPGKVEHIRDIPIGVCPLLILVPEHYRDDDTCRCDDPGATEMKDWGYTWSKEEQRWT